MSVSKVNNYLRAVYKLLVTERNEVASQSPNRPRESLYNSSSKTLSINTKKYKTFQELQEAYFQDRSKRIPNDKLLQQRHKLKQFELKITSLLSSKPAVNKSTKINFRGYKFASLRLKTKECKVYSLNQLYSIVDISNEEREGNKFFKLHYSTQELKEGVWVHSSQVHYKDQESNSC